MSDKVSNSNNPICFFDITIGNTVRLSKQE